MWRTYKGREPRYLRINGLEVTPTHRFARPDGEGEWTRAGELRVGDLVRGITGPIVIETIEPAEQPATVYNLVIAHESHNYYVQNVTSAGSQSLEGFQLASRPAPRGDEQAHRGHIAIGCPHDICQPQGPAHSGAPGPMIGGSRPWRVVRALRAHLGHVEDTDQY